MAQIVDLEKYRRKIQAAGGFRAWRNRFGWEFGPETRLMDIPDRILVIQAGPGTPSTMAFYELIMGLLGYPAELSFEDLAGRHQSQVLDVHLFLADNFRFEVMYRIGWLEKFPGRVITLLEMVLDFQKAQSICHNDPPALASTHPDYCSYRRLVLLDRQVLIRKLIPRALDTFKRKLE